MLPMREGPLQHHEIAWTSPKKKWACFFKILVLGQGNRSGSKVFLLQPQEPKFDPQNQYKEGQMW